MPDRAGESEGLAIAARIIEERSEEIFESYERRLGEIGSLLVVGEGTRRGQLEANAKSILTRAAKVLRGEEQSLLAVEEEIYRNIEASEEPLNPHPDESFRAGTALSKAAVRTVVENLPPGRPAEEVADIALAVQEIVVDRVSRMVMASYVDYLLTKVRETQFEERKRFSRELHDRLAHQMTVVAQSLDLFENFRESNPERAEERLSLAREMADESLTLMREFSRELRSDEAAGGLRIAIENIMRISVPEGVGYEVAFSGKERHIPDYVRDQLYMILREGIRNAVAHSGSDRILVEVGITPTEVTAAIRDHGVGVEASAPNIEGVGLDSMSERAERLGGTFDLSPDPEGGMRAEVRLPLMREKEDS